MGTNIDDVTEATRLKEEGNKLFEKKAFSQAYDKYTAALQKGGDNSILYSNRAACILSQRKFLDAMNDAEKATKLDPTFSKGWGRLAAAYMGLSRADPAILAYNSAIETLPSASLSPAQENQKKQYQDGLRQAEGLSHRIHADLTIIPAEKVKDTPLERADAILKEMRGASFPTSAWVIGKAYEDWKEGREKLEQLKEIRLPDGRVGYYGSQDVITSLTNAILRDPRVFHVDPTTGWSEKVNKQIYFETEMCFGWRDLGPKNVLQQAQIQAANDNWDQKPNIHATPKGGVRKAISTQVRVWILHAFMWGMVEGQCEAAEALLHDTLDFLEKGRTIWSNVPRTVRGVVFDDTFVRGVRALHLSVFRNAVSSESKGKYTFKSLLQLAKNVYEEAKAANETKPNALEQAIAGVDRGFLESFYTYPVGYALSTMAFCYRKLGNDESDEAKKKDLMLKAGKLYHDAAKHYLEDDEFHSYFLTLSLGSYWHSGIAGLDITLPILKDLYASAPKMKQIWEHSVLNEGNGRDGPIKHCLNIYEVFKQGIASGELKEDSPVVPDRDTIRGL